MEALRELPGEGGSEGESGYGQRVRELSEETTGKLEAMARGEQVTLNTLVQGAWSVVLSRYSGQEEVVFGATVSGRPAELAGVERTVGLFLNTLPVRVRVGEQVEIGEWLRGLQAAEAEAREYEYASLAQVQGWSGVGGGGQLFESLVVFENYPVGEGGEREAGVRVKRVRSWERTNYAMTLVVGPGKRLRLRMSYQAGRFTGERMERVLEQMERALEEMAGRGGRGMVGEIDILGEVERRRLLELGRAAGGAEELVSVVETFRSAGEGAGRIGGAGE